MPKAAPPLKPEVNFTNLDKPLFPDTGFTKGDLVQYYIAAAPHLLPHFRDRPVTLIRFPDGVGHESFYEKNAPRFTPEWVHTAEVPRQRHEGSINYILINDVRTLAWCANLASIELHPFLHRAKALDIPTHVAFDLDPGEGADLATCAEVAFLVKDVLDRLQLESFPKVSGSKGVQLYVPLNTNIKYEVTTPFAKAIAELLEQQYPKLVVSNMAKVLRQGRVLIDWSQNSRSKTTVGVYSVRGKRGTPYVSMPVTWDELAAVRKSKKIDRLFFTPEAALKRLDKVGDLFAPVLTTKQKLPKNFVAAAPARAAAEAQTAEDEPGPRRKKTPGKKVAPAKPAADKSAATKPVYKNIKADGALAAYRAKRDFTKTQEPAPEKTTAAPTGPERAFVIQKHAASHLHYDFRLELDGTLKSWAVPKGLPYETGVKRSGFQTEDHPLGYLRFEGTIPAGQYGGGTVMVWDIGTYSVIDGSYEKGNIHFALAGKKLKGEWRIFRIRSDDAKPVWLIVKVGTAMKPLSAQAEDSSALTSRSMAKIAEDNDAQWESHVH